ncbi:Hint domain-containing protein [Celeribacter sp. SCSIO 80788]|uniref:Hint domain-containing protein n=1 Tax=Celeribacter sp. SCSIO 80788 TaxID=3117013 RepID=UPI003DA3D3B3
MWRATLSEADMAWLGAGATDRKPVYNPLGLDKGLSRAKVPARRMALGSLLLETTIPDQFRQPLDLLTFERFDRFRRSLHMVLGPNGRLWLAIESDTALSVLSLDLSDWRKDSPIRILYGWDLARATCWLGAECLDSGAVKSVTAAEPAAIHEEDLARVLFAVEGPALAPDVGCFAFADHVEPLGYAEGLAPGALVETEYGPRAIENLRPGTLIATQTGALSPLLANIRSTLPAVGQMAPLRLRRPFQNLRQTLEATPRCEIVTQGIDTSYLFGAEHVTVRAMHIAPFLPGASPCLNLLSTRHNLVLADHTPYRVAGIAVMPLARNHRAEHGASTRLSHLKADDIPARDGTGPASLLRHEAIALLSERYL